jgi:hypothetical protein
VHYLGVLVVVAAGNEYQNGNPPLYPAAYANAFSVASIQSDNTHAPTSTTNNMVDIAAPGKLTFSSRSRSKKLKFLIRKIFYCNGVKFLR